MNIAQQASAQVAYNATLSELMIRWHTQADKSGNACDECPHNVINSDRVPYQDGYVTMTSRECGGTEHDCPVVAEQISDFLKWDME
jgi:hypothetical protein